MMTEKLFYQDEYMKTFTATATACEQSGDIYKVVLDRTAFFPEGGGQSGDIGTLNGVHVFDTHEKDGVIYHYTKEPIAVGETVEGALDWEERFVRMQQHSGEHIVSGLIHKMYGYDNVGFHLGKDDVTMDFNGVLTKEQMKEIEYLANEAVFRNIEIQTLCPTSEELEKITYRSKIEIEGQVRIILIEGYDCCACCAPHMHRTGEIGLIKLTNIQNYKGGVRISMLSGFRALADYSEKETSVKNIAVSFSAKEHEVYDMVEHLKEEKQSLKQEIGKLQMQLLAYKAKEIEKGEKAVCLVERGLSGNEPRELVNLVLEREVGICAVFAGNDEEGYRYVIGSKTMDTREAAKLMNEKFHGRGGGKPEMVQGSVTGTGEEIYNYFICNFS